MSIKLVVFDMAGTTVKDKNYVAVAFQAAMKQQGYDVPVKDINPLMGYEKPVAIKMMLEQHEPEQAKITDDLIKLIHRHFVSEMISFYQKSDDIQALPNAEDVFFKLRNKGIKVGLDTGFSRDIAEVIVERLNWKDKIDIMVASDEVEHGRPYPLMIQKMMKDLSIINSDSVVKVGDTEVDINEGKNAGCKYVIGITTGAFTKSELEPYEPTHIIDDLVEVLEII